MCEICVFAGTTEGRRLLEFLREQPVRVVACVATEYGEGLAPHARNIEIRAGRLDRSGMETLFSAYAFDLVVDATHPYATEVTDNIAAACEAAGLEYLRLNRDDSDPAEDAVCVGTIREAADFLKERPGTALLATGSRELAPYADVEGFAERFYVRVLPTVEALEACRAAGFPPGHVIAMQGPFSEEMNVATLRSIRAAWLVTKDSGDSGGFAQKLQAARRAGAQCVVVGRPPQREGLRFAEAAELLLRRFHLKDVREIDVVGIGMGAPDCLTGEADAALARCDCVIGARRMVEALTRYGKPAYVAVAPEEVVDLLRAHPEHRRVAVAMSGDTGFFSGAKRLLPRLAAHHVRVIPGLSTLQVLCARLRTSWDDVRAVSLHGREGSVVPAVRRYGKVFALTDGADALRRVCADLCDAGMGDARLSVGQRLSYPDEVIATGTAAELRDADCAPLSAILIERPTAPMPLPVGLPDEAFARSVDGGRVVPMTKSETRAVILSKLRLAEDSVLWDIGAGTGSVSVEAALLCPRGQVFAVERRQDAADLAALNGRRFALRNLSVIHGEAPEALDALPVPTHAFIGGSDGKLEEIVQYLRTRNPDVRIVASAVTPETVGRLAELMRAFEDAELVQVSVARSRRAGEYHLMEGMNPVWIATMQHQAGSESHEDRP